MDDDAGNRPKGSNPLVSCLAERFILFLGTLEPRKNITTLLEAYALLHRRPGWVHRLVIAGGKGWYYDAIYATAERLGLRLVCKGSYRKANRSALGSYVGPGDEVGLAALRRVRDELESRILARLATPDEN